MFRWGEREGGEAVQRTLCAWQVLCRSTRAECSVLVIAVMSLGAPAERETRYLCFLSVRVGVWCCAVQCYGSGDVGPAAIRFASMKHALTKRFVFCSCNGNP